MDVVLVGAGLGDPQRSRPEAVHVGIERELAPVAPAHEHPVGHPVGIAVQLEAGVRGEVGAQVHDHPGPHAALAHGGPHALVRVREPLDHEPPLRRVVGGPAALLELERVHVDRRGEGDLARDAARPEQGDRPRRRRLGGEAEGVAPPLGGEHEVRTVEARQPIRLRIHLELQTLAAVGPAGVDRVGVGLADLQREPLAEQEPARVALAEPHVPRRGGGEAERPLPLVDGAGLERVGGRGDRVVEQPLAQLALLEARIHEQVAVAIAHPQAPRPARSGPHELDRVHVAKQGLLDQGLDLAHHGLGGPQAERRGAGGPAPGLVAHLADHVARRKAQVVPEEADRRGHARKLDGRPADAGPAVRGELHQGPQAKDRATRPREGLGGFEQVEPPHGRGEGAERLDGEGAVRCGDPRALGLKGRRVEEGDGGVDPHLAGVGLGRVGVVEHQAPREEGHLRDRAHRTRGARPGGRWQLAAEQAQGSHQEGERHAQATAHGATPG
ncbi:hypothetical protein D3C86_1066120 [compost metagenome]